jgi:hypothetical protein
VTDGYGNVQAELDAIMASISVLSEMVINPFASVTGAIATFTDSTGKVIGESFYPTALSSYGDLIFPDFGSGYIYHNIISPAHSSSATKGQGLLVSGQDNLGGPGGDLYLSSGYNWFSGKYDGAIGLVTPILVFDASVDSPTITQNPAAAVSDFFIIPQANTSSGAPSNLWLQSGANGIGQAGNINLYTSPGIVNVMSSGLYFDKDYSASIVQHENDVPVATDMYIIAQNITSGGANLAGTPGNLYLLPGYNPNNNTAGNIYLYSSPGGISFAGEIISNIVFEPSVVSPTITQDTIVTPAAPGQTLVVQSQHSDSGTGGDLSLAAGVCVDATHNDGYVNIASRFSNINFFGGALLITESSNVPVVAPSPSGVYLYVSGGELYAKGADLVPHALGVRTLVFSPTLATQTNTINYAVTNTLSEITDGGSQNVAHGWVGLVEAGDVIRGNVYFKIDVTSGSMFLDVRIYEDAVNVAHFTIQVLSTTLSFVTLPIYWQALSSPGTFSVQVWASTTGSAIITQMYSGNKNWGDFEFIRT